MNLEIKEHIYGPYLRVNMKKIWQFTCLNFLALHYSYFIFLLGVLDSFRYNYILYCATPKPSSLITESSGIFKELGLFSSVSRLYRG